MKIIIAKRIGKERPAYINANKVNSFLADVNADGELITKIYFSEGKCEIEGDHTKKIMNFLMSDDDSGSLNLLFDNNGSYWSKRSGEKNESK